MKGHFDLRVKLPPAHLSTTYGGGFKQSLYIAERQAWEHADTNFIVFGSTSLGIEPESTVSTADVLSIRPVIS